MSTTGQSRNGIVWALSTALIASGVIALSHSVATADEIAAAKSSDPATHQSFPGAQDAAAYYATSQHQGNIWTDKSVFSTDVSLTPANGTGSTTLSLDDNELGVVLSALGSTSHFDHDTIPLDLVIVLDNSGSMRLCTFTDNQGCVNTDTTAADSWKNSRAYAMVAAANAAIELVAQNNPASRVGIVYFGDSAIAHWSLVTPTRTTVDEDGDGLNDFIYATLEAGSPAHITARTATGSMTITSGETNIQAGVTRGMELLANQPSAAVSGANQRIPATIILTDGDANESIRTETWWTFTSQPRQGHNISDGDAFKAVMAAAYLKAKVTDVYNDEAYNAQVGSAGYSAAVHTVALSVSTDLSRATLDPAGTANQSSNAVAAKFNGWFNTYSSGASVDTDYAYFSGTYYTVTHPTGTAAAYDVLTNEAYQYNDGYHEVSALNTLVAAFEEIINEVIVTGPNYPLKAEAGRPGYVTFTDELGPYMEVSEITGLTFCTTTTAATQSCQQTTFSNPSKVSAGNVDTYTFSGSYAANSLYGATNLDTIQITVTRSAALAGGDVVTVQLPESLLPLHDTRVETHASGTGTTLNQSIAEPMRVAYKVAPKATVLDNLSDPSALDVGGATEGTTLAEYLRANTTDGAVRFFANAFTEAGGGITAQATASFQPNDRNNYYHVPEDTRLYSDADATTTLSQPAWNALPDDAVVYYVTQRYADGSGTVTQTPLIRSVTKGVLVANQTATAEIYATGGVMYLPTGLAFVPLDSSRDHLKCDQLTWSGGFPSCTAANATGNTTATSDYVRSTSIEQGMVTTRLGNNGSVAFDVSASLKITKEVQPVAGHNPNPNTSFTFTVNLSDASNNPITTAFDYTVYANSAPTTPVRTGTITSGGTVSITAAQHAVIAGLSAGTKYTVSENTPPAGYQFSSSTGATGTIQVAEDALVASFVNTYAASSVVAAVPGATKTLAGRDWQSTDTFTVEFCPATGVCDEVNFTQTGTRAGTASFAAQTFNQPGVYQFTLTEDDSGVLPGMSYSAAVYRWTVTVTDDGSGQLSQTAVLEQLTDDTGTTITPSQVSSAAFTNTFAADTVTSHLEATKLVKDQSLVTSTDDGIRTPTQSFDFEYALVGANLDGHNSTTPAGQPTFAGDTDGDGVVSGTNQGQTISSPAISWNSDQIGHSWYFKLHELPGAHAEMTYSDAVWFWRVVPTVAPGGAISLTSTQCATTTTAITTASPYGTCDPVTNASSYSATTASDREILNEYDPSAGVVTLQGSKTIDGRVWVRDDSFTFNLSANDTATQAAVAAGWITIPSASATVTSANQANETAPFSFANLSFTKQGTYQFAVRETIPVTAQPGMTYDARTLLYNVVVSDPDLDGDLDAAVTVVGNAAGDRVAAFTNTYRATTAFVGIDVVKTLTGRSLNTGEFTFTVTAADQDACDKAGFGASCALSVTNGTPALNRAHLPGGFSFSQADVGTTFVYTITEARGSLGGIDYDATSYEVRLIPALDLGTGELFVSIHVLQAGGSAQIFDSREGITPSVSFVNSYAAAPTTATPLFSKTLDGRSWTASDSFEFQLTALSGGPLPSTTSVHVTSAAQAASFGFGAITFAAAGTYEYQVREIEPSPGLGGMTYDPVLALVQITVTDNGQGQLSASIAYDGNQAFTNVYRTALTWQASVSNVLSGRPAAAGEFGFKITPQDAAAAAISGIPTSGYLFQTNFARADGVAEVLPFGEQNLAFTQAHAGQTFCFDVSQVAQVAPAEGLTYDLANRLLCIAVTDDAAGVLTATTTITGGQTNSFVNSSSTPAGNQSWPVVTFNNLYAEPSWTLSKSASPVTGTQVQPGSTIEYTLTATPQAGRTVSNAVATDALRDLLNAGTVTSITAPPDTTASIVGDDLVWNIGTLTNQLTLTYRVVVHSHAWSASLVTSLTGTANDNPNNDPPLRVLVPTSCNAAAPCVTTHTTPEESRWTISKTANPASGTQVLPGTVLTYTVSATPTAGQPAFDVVITDELADVLDNAALVASSLSASGGTPVLENNQIKWTIAELRTTQTLTYQVTVGTDQWSQTLRNSVSGTAGRTPAGATSPVSTPPDACTAQAPCVTTHPTPAEPRWTVSAVAAPVSGSLVAPGSAIEYTITATPVSGSAAQNVVIFDDLADLLDDATVVSVLPQGTNAGSAQVTGTQLTWTIGTLNQPQVLQLLVLVDTDAWDAQLGTSVHGQASYVPAGSATTRLTPPDACTVELPCATTHHTAPAPVWTITATADPATGSTVLPGSVVGYTIKATPVSGAAAQSVVLTSDLSAVLNNASIDVTGITPPVGTVSLVNNQLIWTIGTLDQEYTLHYSVTVRTTAWTAQLSDAVSGASGYSPAGGVGWLETPPTRCTAAAPCVLDHSTPDRSNWTITKTASPSGGATVQPGERITYTLSVTPVSGRTTTDVVITDDLSGLLTNAVLNPPAISAPAGTSATVAGGILTWNIPALDRPFTLTYSVRVNSDAWGVSLVNAVSGAASYLPAGGSVRVSTPPESCTTTAPCTVTHVTPAEPKWTISKTADPDSNSQVMPGSLITYTVTAHPVSGQSAYDVVITDDLGDVLDNGTLVGTLNTSGGSAVVDNGQIRWTISELDATQTLTYQVSVGTDQWNATLRNSVSGVAGRTPSGATAPVSTPPNACTVTDPCSTTHTTPVRTQWVVDYSATPVSGSEVLPGSTIEYTIRATPASVGAPQNVVIYDNIADVLDDAAVVSVEPIGTSVGTVEITGSQLIWTIGTLDQTYDLRLIVTVNTDAWDTQLGTSLYGQAGYVPYGSVATVLTPPDTCNITEVCTTAHRTPIEPRWTLSAISDPADGTTVLPGSVVNFTVTAAPVSGSNAQNVVIVSDLTEVLAHATIDLDTITPPQGTVALIGNELVWTLGTLNAEYTLEFAVTVQHDAWTVDFENTVFGTASYVSTGSGQVDTPPERCSVTDPCVLGHATPPRPVWSIAKTSSPDSGSTLVPGATITYRVVVTPVRGSNATDVVITDALTEVLQYAALDLDGIVIPDGTAVRLTDDQLIWTIDELDAEYVLEYTVRIDEGAYAAELVNSVSGTASYLPYGAAAALDTPPQTCTTADPCSTLHLTTEPPPIPTGEAAATSLYVVALIGFGLLGAAGCLLVVWRRRQAAEN